MVVDESHADISEEDGVSEREEGATPRTSVLGHFANYRFTPRFWEMDAAGRRERARAWFEDVRAAADLAHPYLLQGIEEGADVMVWSTASADEEDASARYFMRRAMAESRHRDIVEPVKILWGLTRPSEYSKARSAQEIDSFAAERRRYLVVYPFTKTAAWYLLGRETRQGMMNEHIRIGKQFRLIKQLLLYSFGVQDQEFVVVYEMDDLRLFSRLVHELRGTEGRRYTASDAPLHTGILTRPADWLDTLG